MRVRSAIAGAGFIGAVHAHAVRVAGGTVAGVLASTASRGAEAAERLGAERAYDDVTALLEDASVDVVHVCTPNHLHEELALQALAAGKHVICEKPLALDATGAARLADAAAGVRTVTAVPFVYRYYPTVHEARDRVGNGESGAVRLIHGTYLQDWLLTPTDDNWRVDAELGGASRAFADIGSHWCDLVEFVTGERITRLCARTLTAVPQRVRDESRAAFTAGGNGGAARPVTTEDAAVLQFVTDGGAIGSAVISQVSAGRKNRLWFEIDCAKESLVFDQEDAESLWVGRRDRSLLVRKDAGAMSAPAAQLATLPPGHPQGYQDCFDLFVRDVYAAVRGEAQERMPGFADGLRAAHLTDAVLASSREERWIDVPAVEVPR